MKNDQKKTATKLIVSNDENPKVELKAGTKFKVETIELVDAPLQPIKKGAARLCGGTSTCLALIDIED